MIIEESFTKNDGIWIIIFNEFKIPGEKIHIIPKNDICTHKVFNCSCGSKIEQEKSKNDDYYYIVTHKSYDGRERKIYL